ncbi:protein FAM149B1-like isoform X1 [Clavelina lepadiformis]|uniref:protein FAM149B1-like isoform X1 n=1 Tax=Clavelina lepadiformis TaxID=159417 RepID=UPI004041B3B8
MAGRFTRQPNGLEIRGISRGSLLDHPRVEPVDEPLLAPPSSRGLYFYETIHAGQHLMDAGDDDDSTITGGSDEERRTINQSLTQSDDTIAESETSHYWSAGNSFTTGNTTERSSVYSWGDDEFDHQASQRVREMFQEIERMLFEGVLSGSISLQQECREWMVAFPHLRIIGKQLLPPCDIGQWHPVAAQSKKSSIQAPQPTNDLDPLDVDSLEVRGSSVPTHAVPSQHFHPPDQDNIYAPTSVGSKLPHLYEEIFEQDGTVEEYLAYDIREMDEEENTKRYYIPRRRRLGFPPITPNACVRDAVLHQVFDVVWNRVVACLSSDKRSKASLLKHLVQNISRAQDTQLSENLLHATEMKDNSQLSVPTLRYPNDHRSQQIGPQNFFPENLDYEEGIYPHQLPGDRFGVQPLNPASSMMMMPPMSRLLNPDVVGLPLSRGSYFDQANSRHLPFSQGRLSTAPYSNTGDINSLNDVMKISQKKLQARSERLPLPNDDFSGGPLHDSRFSGRPLSSHFVNGSNIPGSGNPLGAMSHHLSAIAISGTPSPLATPNRPFNRDMLARQPSATTRKGRGGRLARLLPLDRAKTPNIEFDGYVKATKLIPGHLEPQSTSFSGRINSPPHSFQPPPTAPNLGTWMNSRLPPISSGLESLQENTLMDFKRTRGKTAHTRIASALADEKPVNRALENMSRPNTTHTFRADNLVQKRSTSVTPSNFMFGAQGNSIGIPTLKTSSPAGAGFLATSSGSNLPYPQQSATSPDNVTGLVGITGRSINLGLGQSTSPDEEPGPPHSSWGLSSQNMSAVRRKRAVFGLI